MIADLLSRLEGVRQVGPDRYRSRCPAHDGRSRDTLSITETADGTVLIRCFHGCAATDVVASVGLQLSDLFPKRDWRADGHASPPRRPRTDWPALIAAAERDLLLVKIVLVSISNGEPITSEDAATCQAAATRVYTLIQEQRDIEAAYRRAAQREAERRKEKDREAAADSAIAKQREWNAEGEAAAHA